MAGKCNFLTAKLFGKVGRAPLKAIYARAHSHQTSLDKPTRAALYALMDIISHCRPMRIPREPQVRHFPIIYTDAYYTADRQRLRPSDPIPEGWQPQDYATVDNGFGAVIFPSGESDRAWFFQGRLPKEILKQFSSNTAFIWHPFEPVCDALPIVPCPMCTDEGVQRLMLSDALDDGMPGCLIVATLDVEVAQQGLEDQGGQQGNPRLQPPKPTYQTPLVALRSCPMDRYGLK